MEGLACTTGVRDTPGREKDGGGFMMGNGDARSCAGRLVSATSNACDDVCGIGVIALFFVEKDEEEKDMRMGQKRKRWPLREPGT